VARCVVALQTQVSRDFATTWGIDAEVRTTEEPAEEDEPLYLLDDASQADALGFHARTSWERPCGFVFVRPCLEVGDSWQATASHELMLEDAREAEILAERLPEYEENYRRSGGMRSLSHYCEKRGDRHVFAAALRDRVHVLPCDLADKEAVEALVPSAEEKMDKVDILVANAGINRDNLFVQLRDEDWDDVIQVNLTATFRLARAATKLMMRKRFGRIIAITSIVGVTGNPGQANYTASKAGLIGLIKTLGAEYAKRNVTANCIAPGFIATPMTDALNDKQRETILTKVPAARLGTPEDIAAAAVYLSSNEAAYVTGQTIHVNGGMAMI